MANWRTDGRTIPVVCLALLFGGLVVDLNTNQALVVAIIYAIPIAISGLMSSSTLTWWCIGLAVLANIAAGYDNISTFGIVDGITILNRLLAGLSFLLIGVMTLLFESTSEEVEHLSEAEEDSERQRRLREFMVDLSGPLEPEELMQRAVSGLRRLLGADAVVATGLDGARFAEPRWADPAASDLAATGTMASWAVDALPITDRPVIAVRSDQGMMSVGRWRCESSNDLIVLVARPDRRRAAGVLGDALSVLDPIRERAIELRQARRGEWEPPADEDLVVPILADAAAGGGVIVGGDDRDPGDDDGTDPPSSPTGRAPDDPVAHPALEIDHDDEPDDPGGLLVDQVNRGD